MWSHQMATNESCTDTFENTSGRQEHEKKMLHLCYAFGTAHIRNRAKASNGLKPTQPAEVSFQNTVSMSAGWGSRGWQQLCLCGRDSAHGNYGHTLVF